MSEYDQRQYRRMLDALTAFEGGILSPDILLAELTGFLGVLEQPEPSWARKFQNGLGGLDEDLSVAIDRWEQEGELTSKEISFDEETVKRMRETAAELKRLVLRKIEAPADGAESTE